MAFLNSEQIAPLLADTSCNRALLSGQLIKLKIQLQNLGLVFDTRAATTWKATLDDRNFAQSIFDFYPSNNITNVTIKSSLDSNYQMPLVLNLDYTLKKHYNLDDYYYRIELPWRIVISPCQYLEITGQKGIFIDLATDSTSDLAQLIISSFVEYMNGYLIALSTGFRSIANSKLGDSLLSFHDNDKIQINFDSMLESDCFATLIDFISV